MYLISYISAVIAEIFLKIHIWYYTLIQYKEVILIVIGQ